MKAGIILVITFCKTIQCITATTYVRKSANLTIFPSDIPPTTESIDLTDNAISTIPGGALAGMTTLEILKLPINLLTTVPNLCDVGHSLAILSLYSNRITSVPEKHISCLKVLRNIYLGYNRFIEFPDLSVLGQTLTSFYFNYNRVENIKTDILSNLTKLMYLDISRCNFDENQILTLGLNSSQIKTLLIPDNNIRIFPETILAKLDILATFSLGENPYQALPRLDQVKSTVKDLNFDGYKMIAVPDGYLKGMNRLVTISLKVCELKTWPLTLDDVANTIEKIDLSHNQIQDIPILTSMPKLTTLNLNFNALNTIPEDAFQEAPQLTHLKLMGNGLQTLYDVGTNVLQTIKLTGNPLVCDCRLTWLKTLIEGNYVDISDTRGPVTCMNPEELSGLDFMHVTKEMMCAAAAVRWYRNPNVMDSDNGTTVDQPALTTDDCALLCLSCVECRAFDMKAQNPQCRLFMGNSGNCKKEQSEYFIRH